MLTPNVEELGTQRTIKFDQPSISTQTSFVVADLQAQKSPKNEVPSTSTHIFSKVSLPQQNVEDDFVDKLLKNTTAELQTIKSDVKECLSILEESKKEDPFSSDDDQHKKSPEKTAKKKVSPKEKITPRSQNSSSRSDNISTSKNVKQTSKQKTIIKPSLPEKQKNNENDRKYLSVQLKLEKKTVKSERKTDEAFSPISEDNEISANKSPTVIVCNNTYKISTENKIIQTEFVEINTPVIKTPQESPKKLVTFKNKLKPEDVGKQPFSKIDELLVIEQSSDKVSQLSIQTLPAVDIRRPLVTQKMPDVVIQPCTTDQENIIVYDNVKYSEYVHADVNRISKSLDLKQQSPKKHKESPIILNVSADVLLDESDISLKQIEETKEIVKEDKKNVSINEEFYVNLDEIPSVRTLKEIQNYLEHRCSLIKERLEQERDLNPGECISLKWKLNQPPKWKTSSPIRNTEVASKEKTILLEPSTSKYYHEPYLVDKSIQYSNSNSSKSEPVITLKKTEKENQIIVLKDIQPKKFSIAKATQYSLQSDSKAQKSEPKKIELHKFTEQFSLLGSKVFQEREMQTININPKQVDAQCSPKKIQAKEIPATKQPKNYNIIKEQNETGVQTSNLEIKNSTTQCSMNIPQSALTTKSELIHERLPINEKKDCNTQTSLEKPTTPEKIMKCSGNDTQYDLQDIYSSCDVNEENISPRKIKISTVDSCTQCCSKNIYQPILSRRDSEVISLEPSFVEMKDCHTQISSDKEETIIKSHQDTMNKAVLSLQSPKHVSQSNKNSSQFSPAQKINIDHYKINKLKLPSEIQSHNSKHFYRSLDFDSSSESSSSKIIKPKNKCVPQQFKKCSTPISPISTCTSENYSLSEGEVKLPCECSTSIGEIHLCHLANNIRKKVEEFKDKPSKLLKQTMHSNDIQFAYEHKHYDNWVSYYVTKTNRSLSSGEIGTISNLSSVKSSD